MAKLWRLLRYGWPLHFVLLLTNWLPDNVFFLRLRGWLSRPFFGKCGSDLRLGRNLTFYNPANLEIGAHVYLAYGGVFLAGNERITIGDEVVVGPYCVLVTENHSRLDGSYRFGRLKPGPIAIRSGSWLGAQVVVTAGSVVGVGSLVAAGAIVTGEFPSNCMLGGVPARKIKDLG